MQSTVLMLLVVLLTIGCDGAKEHSTYAKCGTYMWTLSTLVKYNQAFYPDFDLGDVGILPGDDLLTKWQKKGKKNINDYWGNNFKLSKDKTFTYSFGENGIDDNSLVDDIFIDSKSNKGFYCPHLKKPAEKTKGIDR